MSHAVTAGDLRARYVRLPGSPVARGDHVRELHVRGFAYAAEAARGDVMLVDADEALPVPPCRAIPDPADPAAGVRLCGPSPVQCVAPADLHEADPAIAAAVEARLGDLGRDGDLIRGITADLAAAGHLTWLVGGAVRDLLADGSAARVNDLDYAGTAGPGTVDGLAGLRLRGAGDYTPSVSPRNVWALRPPPGPDGRRSDRIIEYKPLAQDGFRFRAFGGNLQDDAAARDLTFNALYYDHHRGVVADPLGHGLADLLGSCRMAATPYCGDDPAEQACIILRCLKFMIRWTDLDVSRVTAWAGDLPEDLAGCIPSEQRRSLASLRRRCVPARYRGPDELGLAGRLGPAAVRLLIALQREEECGHGVAAAE